MSDKFLSNETTFNWNPIKGSKVTIGLSTNRKIYTEVCICEKKDTDTNAVIEYLPMFTISMYEGNNCVKVNLGVNNAVSVASAFNIYSSDDCFKKYLKKTAVSGWYVRPEYNDKIVYNRSLTDNLSIQLIPYVNENQNPSYIVKVKKMDTVDTMICTGAEMRTISSLLMSFVGNAFLYVDKYTNDIYKNSLEKQFDKVEKLSGRVKDLSDELKDHNTDLELINTKLNDFVNNIVYNTKEEDVDDGEPVCKPVEIDSVEEVIADEESPIEHPEIPAVIEDDNSNDEYSDEDNAYTVDFRKKKDESDDASEASMKRLIAQMDEDARKHMDDFDMDEEDFEMFGSKLEPDDSTDPEFESLIKTKTGMIVSDHNSPTTIDKNDIYPKEVMDTYVPSNDVDKDIYASCENDSIHDKVMELISKVKIEKDRRFYKVDGRISDGFFNDFAKAKLFTVSKLYGLFIGKDRVGIPVSSFIYSVSALATYYEYIRLHPETNREEAMRLTVNGISTSMGLDRDPYPSNEEMNDLYKKFNEFFISKSIKKPFEGTKSYIDLYKVDAYIRTAVNYVIDPDMPRSNFNLTDDEVVSALRASLDFYFIMWHCNTKDIWATHCEHQELFDVIYSQMYKFVRSIIVSIMINDNKLVTPVVEQYTYFLNSVAKRYNLDMNIASEAYAELRCYHAVLGGAKS